MPDSSPPTHERWGYREVPMRGGSLDGQARTIRLPVEDRTPYILATTRERWVFDASLGEFHYDGIEARA